MCGIRRKLYGELFYQRFIYHRAEPFWRFFFFFVKIVILASFFRFSLWFSTTEFSCCFLYYFFSSIQLEVCWCAHVVLVYARFVTFKLKVKIINRDTPEHVLHLFLVCWWIILLFFAYFILSLHSPRTLSIIFILFVRQAEFIIFDQLVN